jgi:multicomponent Na+:H+ antiporter subunit D
VLLGLGIATAVVGAVMALALTQLKRMLAFLTMSHLGIYLIGVGLLTQLGLAGAALLVIGDALAKSALFLGVGVVQHQRSTVSEIKLRGRGRGLAVTGVTVVLGPLALADLPPFVSSDGHALLVEAADRAGLPWLEVVIALTVALSSGAVLRAAGRIWLGWGTAESPSPDGGTGDDAGDSAAAAAAFSDRAVYAAQVLGTRGAAVTARGPVVAAAARATSAAGPLTELDQVAAAFCVAAITLDRRAVRLRRALAAGTGWLRRLHSGLVGDQVTWLVAGLALLAAAGGVAPR